jgi:hypothetical protein
MTKNIAYHTGEDAWKSYASEQFTDESPISRTSAQTSVFGRTFVGWESNISVRSDFNRGDYDYFRPSEAMPYHSKEIMAMCMEAYKKNGQVRNVIDTMSDFASQGIRLQHPITATENFYQAWWAKIKGKERSERMLNMLYRAGNVIIRRSYGKIKPSQVKDFKRAKAKHNEDAVVEEVQTFSRQIPLKYIIMNPLAIEVLGGDIATFVDKPVFVLQVGPALRNIIKQADFNRDPRIKDIVEQIPSDVMAAIRAGSKNIPLPPDKIEVMYYKKDDWELWANPMIYCIINDIIMLEKMKLADTSALDGAISNIRLWKLGIIFEDNPANSILPTRTQINKLRNILANAGKGGVLDLIWGPELDFKESNSQVWRFLGSEKYVETKNAINEGLGIPPTMRSGGKGSTNTGNNVGLNTLVKRLQYGRDRLVEFWTKEIKIVHDAMGFPGRPPEIMFDFMSFADEVAEKTLLVNLWDRDVISTETVLEYFGRSPRIEQKRMSEEIKNRKAKASPYHVAQPDHEYKKIFAQAGTVTPSELGIELDERKEGEQNLMEIQKDHLEVQKDHQIEIEKSKPRPAISARPKTAGGRPKGKTETSKRKKKPTEKSSTRAELASLLVWSTTAYQTIAKMVNPAMLHALGKENLRQLTDKESNLLETTKFAVLSHLEAREEISPIKIAELVQSKTVVKPEIQAKFKAIAEKFVSENGREPTLEETRQMQVNAYTFSVFS